MGRSARSSRFAVVLATTASVLGFSAIGAGSASAASSCDLVASTTGLVGAPGTEVQPLKSAQALISALAPGQTGCLRQGTYVSEDQIKMATRNITLASYPGETAKLVGRLWIAQGADAVTVEGLVLDGENSKNLPSPTVNASNSTFRDNDVSNGHTAICFNLGHPTFGRADNTTIESNRIHDCGALPATNHDHGIYVSEANGTVIRDNLIYDNADRGIQLYPNSQGARITGNVIDGNGQGIIFGGDTRTASSDNVVENNVITNSTIRYNVEASWPGPTGQGNVVRNNCIQGGVRDTGNGAIQSPQVGFTATGNVVADPGYTNRGAKDFAVDPSSPCAALLAGGTSAGSSVKSGTPVALSLKSGAREAQRGQKVNLRGRAVNLRAVEIEVRRRSSWRRVDLERVANNHFELKVRVEHAGRIRYRAKATEGGHASRPVKIKVVR